MNKTLLRPLSITAAVLLAPTFAHAVALTTTLYEGFDYTTTDNAGNNATDGDIAGNTGGIGFGGSFWGTGVNGGTNTVLNVISPSLSYPGLTSTGNALQLNSVNPVGGTANSNQQFFRPLNLSIDTGTFYFSFLVRQDADSDRTINFALFGDATGVTADDTERVTVGQFSGTANSTNGNFGATQTNTASTAVVGSTPISFDPGLTYLLVGRVDFNVSGVNDILRLYINPVVGDPEPATPYLQTNGLVDYGSIKQIRPFTGNAVSPLPASIATFDEIYVGPTYTSVTTPVPEPGSLALLGLAAGGFLMRRRRV